MHKKTFRNCIVLLGGSFDPVHNGHIALAQHFCLLFHTRNLRIIPAGNPWQKPPLKATAAQRVEMLRLAFASHDMSAFIDQQEIKRPGKTYSIDTVKKIRQEVGSDVPLLFLIGIDQLLQLNTWKEWKSLFNYVHICVASRPEFSLEKTPLPEEVEKELTRRLAIPEKIQITPSGLMYMASDLAIKISSTDIRAELQDSVTADALLPENVLVYIKEHHLYGT